MTCDRLLVFHGFLHQEINRRNIAKILLIVSLDTTNLTFYYYTIDFRTCFGDILIFVFHFINSCLFSCQMKSYHPYMLRPPEIMEKKRKESLSVKKKRLFKKQNKSNSKKDNNREEFSYIGSSPTVKYKNDGYSKVEIIYSSNKKPEISEDLLNGNGGKIRGLRLTKTELKDKHRRRKRRTVGYLWRKLFRRKRKKESSNNESKRQTNHRCVIS